MRIEGDSGMKKSLLLYSANTSLAYWISQKYYGELHHVWCSPHFNSTSLRPHEHSIPPSSSPAQLYRNLEEIARGGDRNNAQVLNNKSGLRFGALKKWEAGVISDAQLREINWIIDAAESADFSPLLYIIPFTKLVARLASEVAPQDKAHPFSDDYLIDKLPRTSFDVVRF